MLIHPSFFIVFCSILKSSRILLISYNLILLYHDFQFNANYSLIMYLLTTISFISTYTYNNVKQRKFVFDLI